MDLFPGLLETLPVGIGSRLDRARGGPEHPERSAGALAPEEHPRGLPSRDSGMKGQIEKLIATPEPLGLERFEGRQGSKVLRDPVRAIQRQARPSG